MKLSELASEPQLVKITIDDTRLVEKYGEAIEFWIHDRQDMDTYMRLVNMNSESGLADLARVVKDLILDENGNRILTGKNQLPIDVMVKTIEETVKRLGNSATQTLETSAQN